MLAALGALGSLAGAAGGQGSMDTSSSAISGNTIGGINLGNQANLRNLPDFIANRASTKPQMIDSNISGLHMAAMVGGAALIVVLLVKRLK